MLLTIPSAVWSFIIIQRFFASGNNCRTQAEGLWIIHLVLLFEAGVFFIKLLVVISSLAFSIVSIYASDVYNSWKVTKDTEKAYEAVLNNDLWKIRQSEVDPQEF